MKHSTLAIAFACITSISSWGCLNAPPAEPSQPGGGGAGDGAGGGSAIEPIECGSSALYVGTHDVCDSMDVAGAGGVCNCIMGYYWNGTGCVYLDACECVGTDCDKLTLTEAECQASHASCTEVPVISCGSSEMHAAVHGACDPMDVSLVGECNCMLGFVWDGQACVALAGGCECVGYDCDKVSQTIEECEQAHAECA
jgi:hypothetical protein